MTVWEKYFLHGSKKAQEQDCIVCVMGSLLLPTSKSIHAYVIRV